MPTLRPPTDTTTTSRRHHAGAGGEPQVPGDGGERLAGGEPAETGRAGGEQPSSGAAGVSPTAHPAARAAGVQQRQSGAAGEQHAETGRVGEVQPGDGVSPTAHVGGVDKGVQRRELGVFLRSRRERIRPEEVGLAPGGRRRTPGLRREEVALLAGVGVTWYTWLEQGRDINVSAQVLEAVSSTLRLDRQERKHLYTLAGVRLGPATGECAALPRAVQKMLDAVSPYPAVVLNSRYDILAFNDAYCEVVLDIREIPVEQRNMLWLTFVSKEWRCSFADADSIKVHLVAGYRAALADHLGEHDWQDLTQRLLAGSPEFAEQWERYDVGAPSTRIKVLEHPAAGVLRVEPAIMWLSQLGQTRATVYTPADEATEAKLQTLVSG